MEHDTSTKINLFTIWSIGVGSALGGDFFGWQFVLYGGFSSAIVAVIITGGFYWLYSGVMTELAARYRTSGGSFDFVKSALGRRAAVGMAILGMLKLLLANAANALAISSYLVQAGMTPKLKELCWIAMYTIFTYLDCIGVKQSANIQILATFFCVLILVFYGLSAFSIFDFSNITSSKTTAATPGLGFMQGLPFALQFFDGFEEIPLLMGYAEDPEVNIPKGLLLSYVTVCVLAFLILIAGSGATLSSTILTSEAPLMDGLEAVYGTGTILSDILAYFIVIGLIVNFFAFVLFCSQQISAIAEAKFLPSFLTYRHPVHETPVYASIACSIVGVLLTASFSYTFGDDAAQNTLVTAALMPAALGYILVLECIVKTRKLEAGYPSSRAAKRIGYDPGSLRFEYGHWGARLGQVICALFVIGLLVLASTSSDFGYGLVTLTVLALISFLLIWRSVPSKSVYELTHVDFSSDNIDDVAPDQDDIAQINKRDMYIGYQAVNNSMHESNR